MIRIKGLTRIALLAIVTLLWGFEKDENLYGEKTASGKTSLFEKVSDPEPQASRGSEEAYRFSSDLYSGSSGGGSTTSTGDWGGGNPNGQFEPGVLTAGEWNDLDNWDFWKNLLNNQEYYEENAFWIGVL